MAPVPYIQNIAVVVFFCMSGYTIAWVVDGMSHDGFWRFAFDRFMRLSIPLVPTLLFFAAVEFLLYGTDHPYSNFSLKMFVGNLLFLQDLAFTLPGSVFGPYIRPFGVNHPLWTVAMEFWIYIAFGGFVFAARLASWRSAPAVLAAMLASGLLASVLHGGQGAGLPMIWGLGAIVYYALKYAPPLSINAKLVLLPLWGMFAVALAQPSAWPVDGGFSATYNLLIFANFVFFVLILGGANTPNSISRAAVFFGKFAYTIYLVHYPFIYIIYRTQILPPGDFSAIAVGAASIAFAWGFSLPFEQRYRNIRAWFWDIFTRMRFATP